MSLFDDILDDAVLDVEGVAALYNGDQGCTVLIDENVEQCDEHGNLNILRRTVSFDTRYIDPAPGASVELENGAVYEIGRYVDRSGNLKRYEVY